MPKPKKADLPPNILESDTTYPEWSNRYTVGHLESLGLTSIHEWQGQMTFYQITGRTGTRWVLLSLHISNPSRGQRQRGVTTARSYGIGVDDKKIYTVGTGPHVKATVTVYLNASNVERLRPYVELWLKGLEDASAIRDRISSRRAQGQLHRAAGKSFWNWDS